MLKQTNKPDNLQSAINSAVWRLTKRDHSTYELQQKLTQKGFERQIIEQVITFCFEHDYLNEQRFAQSFVRLKAGRGYGIAVIKQELAQHKISAENQLLAFEMYEKDHDWFELALAQKQKKFGDEPPQDLASKQKQQQFLYRKGFSGEQIEYAVNCYQQ